MNELVTENNKPFPPMLLHSVIDCEVVRLGVHGEGVAVVNGFTLFIPLALPGDTVSVRVTELAKTYGRAKLLEIHKESPDRVKPVCPLFGRCGGCQLMHLSYSGQLRYKKQRVADDLLRIAEIANTEIGDCLASPRPKAYRNKIELPYRVRNRVPTFGFYRENSHDIIRVEDCPVHLDLGEKVYKYAREAILECMLPPYHDNGGNRGLRHLIVRTALSTGQALVVMVTSGIPNGPLKKAADMMMARDKVICGVLHNKNLTKGNVVLGPDTELLAGQPFMVEKIGNWEYELGGVSFFQVNPYQAKQMLEKVLALAAVKPEETVLDAFCGVGFFTIPLASMAKSVIGIEEVPEAVRYGERNGKRNKLTNVSFKCGPAEKLIQSLPRTDVVVVDPPRKGCEPAFLQAVVTQQPSRIVYVSCNPASLARDVKFLAQNGYRVDAVQPLDMFPHTAHVETVVRLVR